MKYHLILCEDFNDTQINEFFGLSNNDFYNKALEIEGSLILDESNFLSFFNRGKSLNDYILRIF